MTTQYIDLYPEALRRRSVPLSAAQVALACLALALALGAWSVLTRNHTRTLAAQAAQIEQQLKAERDQLAALGQQAQAQKADPMLSAQLAGAEALLAARREAIAVLEQGRIGNALGFSEYLRAFARQSLPGLWLTGFDITAGGSDLGIDGRALDAELLPRYVRRLNAEQVFRGRNFATLEMKGAPEVAVKTTAPGNVAGKGAAPLKPALPAHVEFRLATRDGPEAKP